MNSVTNNSDEKACRACKVTKPLDAFHKHPQTTDGHEATCKLCKVEQAKARKQKRLDGTAPPATPRPRWRSDAACRDVVVVEPSVPSTTCCRDLGLRWCCGSQCRAIGSGIPVSATAPFLPALAADAVQHIDPTASGRAPGHYLPLT